MMLITGMLIFGKISVGVRTIASPPMIRMRMAITTIVYGRRNASRTIHMGLTPKTARIARSARTETGLQDQLHGDMNHLQLHSLPQCCPTCFIYLLDPKVVHAGIPPTDFDAKPSANEARRN